MLAFTACGSDSTSSTSVLPLPPRIGVTSVKGDPESELLAAIFARVLEDGRFRVARKDPVELDRAGYYQAIQDGEFQLIPDYSGDLLSFVYSQPDAAPLPSTPTPSAPATTQAPIPVTTTTLPPTTVAGADTTDTTDTTETTGATTTAAVTTTTTGTTTTGSATTDGAATTTTVPAVPSNGHSVAEQVLAINAGMPDALVVNNGSLAENRPVVACTEAAMEANASTQLITLTNLASVAPNIVLGGSAEFLADDSAGYPAMQRYYGGEFKNTVTVDDADLAAAIADGDADCFGMNSLNPLITTEKMTIIEDDQLMAPSNAVVALIASTSATPDVMNTLDAVLARLTTKRLNQMLNEIVVNGTDPFVVANAFVDTL